VNTENQNYNFLKLTRQVHKLTKLIHQALEAEIADYDISRLHVPYIKILSMKEDGVTQKELTKILDVDKANTSRAVNDLIKKGYVKKAYQENLEVNYRLLLTEKGIVLANKMMKTIENKYVELFSILGVEELNEFSDMLERVIGDR